MTTKKHEHKCNNENNDIHENHTIIKEHGINKGTGAGGAQTNKNGLSFEDKTDNEKILLSMDYKKTKIPNTKKKNKCDYYLINDNIIFVKKKGLNRYLEHAYNTHTLREPDEAYIITNKSGKSTIIILEKKNQNCAGSVDIKLWASGWLKIEYEKMIGDIFEVHYCLCLSKYFKQKMESNEERFVILSEILKENNIKVFYGDDTGYFTDINEFIKSFV